MMKTFRQISCALLLFVTSASAVRAQETVPDGPFKTVHLMIVTPVQEAFLLSAIKDFNHGFAAQGCGACAYHAFRMAVGKPQKYNYMVTADWPSSDVYLKIHNSAAFKADNEKNPIFTDLSKTEFYGRYVEVK